MPVPPHGAAPGTHGPINPHAKESGNGRDPEHNRQPGRSSFCSRSLAHRGCLMATKNKQSVLGAELREIADSHPGVQVHPNSPVGPYVRAVLWTAKVSGCQLRGQILWDPDGGPCRWTVRAFDEADPAGTLQVLHPTSKSSKIGKSTRLNSSHVAIS